MEGGGYARRGGAVRSMSPFMARFWRRFEQLGGGASPARIPLNPLSDPLGRQRRRKPRKTWLEISTSEYLASFMASIQLRLGTFLKTPSSFFSLAKSTGRTILILVMIYVLGVRIIWVCGDGMSEWDIPMRQFCSVFF